MRVVSEVPTRHGKVELICQCSLIDAARTKLQCFSLSINNIDMVCNYRRPISIPISDCKDHCEAFKVSEMFINRDLDYLHASLHSELSLDQLGYGGCAHAGMPQ